LNSTQYSCILLQEREEEVGKRGAEEAGEGGAEEAGERGAEEVGKGGAQGEKGIQAQKGFEGESENSSL
jgi:hypothetical protein